MNLCKSLLGVIAVICACVIFQSSSFAAPPKPAPVAKKVRQVFDSLSARERTGRTSRSDKSEIIYDIAKRMPVVKDFAGTGKRGNSGDGGLKTKAELHIDGHSLAATNSDLYFAQGDYQKTVRKIDFQTGIIDTVIGTGNNGDGAATKKNAKSVDLAAANLKMVGDGEILYLANAATYPGTLVYRYDPKTGILEPFAGWTQTGSAEDLGGLIKGYIGNPFALTVKDHILIIADQEQHKIWSIDPRKPKLNMLIDGTKSHTVADQPTDPDGVIKQPQTINLKYPMAITANENDGVLYISNKSEQPHTIKRFDLSSGKFLTNLEVLLQVPPEKISIHPNELAIDNNQLFAMDAGFIKQISLRDKSIRAIGFRIRLPYGLTFNPYHQLLIGDGINNKIHVVEWQEP